MKVQLNEFSLGFQMFGLLYNTRHNTVVFIFCLKTFDGIYKVSLYWKEHPQILEKRKNDASGIKVTTVSLVSGPHHLLSTSLSAQGLKVREQLDLWSESLKNV